VLRYLHRIADVFELVQTNVTTLQQANSLFAARVSIRLGALRFRMNIRIRVERRPYVFTRATRRVPCDPAVVSHFLKRNERKLAKSFSHPISLQARTDGY